MKGNTIKIHFPQNKHTACLLRKLQINNIIMLLIDDNLICCNLTSNLNVSLINSSKKKSQNVVFTLFLEVCKTDTVICQIHKKYIYTIIFSYEKEWLHYD